MAESALLCLSASMCTDIPKSCSSSALFSALVGKSKGKLKGLGGPTSQPVKSSWTMQGHDALDGNGVTESQNMAACLHSENEVTEPQNTAVPPLWKEMRSQNHRTRQRPSTLEMR